MAGIYCKLCGNKFKLKVNTRFIMVINISIESVLNTQFDPTKVFQIL